MATISQAVSEIVGKSAFMEEGLVSGIINYAYLADMIKPEVERIAKKQTNRYAIVMALRRMGDSLGESFVVKAKDMLNGASVGLSSGIFDMTIRRNQHSAKAAAMLYEMVDFENGDFLAVTFGTHEINVMANIWNMEKLSKIFPKNDVINTMPGLSSLTIRITKNAAGAVGLLYAITKALSWEGINIVEVVSTYTEEIFIIKEQDAARSYNAINRLIGKT